MSTAMIIFEVTAQPIDVGKFIFEATIVAVIAWGVGAFLSK